MGLTPANLCWMEKLQIQLFYEHRRKLNMFQKIIVSRWNAR